MFQQSGINNPLYDLRDETKIIIIIISDLRDQVQYKKLLGHEKASVRNWSVRGWVNEVQIELIEQWSHDCNFV